MMMIRNARNELVFFLHYVKRDGTHLVCGPISDKVGRDRPENLREYFTVLSGGVLPQGQRSIG